MKPFPLSTKVSPFMPDEGGRGKRQETTAAPGYCNSPKRKTRWFPSIRQTPPFLFCPRSAKPQANHDVSPLPVSPPGDALPWNTALAVLACHMPEPASSGLWQVFYLPGWKTREACSAVRAMSLHRFTMEEGTRYSLREWICSPSGPMLQMVGTPRLELKPASDALS